MGERGVVEGKGRGGRRDEEEEERGKGDVGASVTYGVKGSMSEGRRARELWV